MSQQGLLEFLQQRVKIVSHEQDNTLCTANPALMTRSRARLRAGHT
jgi:hypothetical protein